MFDRAVTLKTVLTFAWILPLSPSRNDECFFYLYFAQVDRHFEKISQERAFSDEKKCSINLASCKFAFISGITGNTLFFIIHHHHHDYHHHHHGTSSSFGQGVGKNQMHHLH